jgi:hypothetical protein
MMRRRHALALAAASMLLPAAATADSPVADAAPLDTVALADAAAPAHAAAPAPAPAPAPAAACSSPGAPECPAYDRYVNHKYGFSVDVPTFFTKKPGDADGRGQPFEYGAKARVRAWAMFDNPPMTVQQLYGDWTRRDGITFKTLAVNTWVVRGREGARLYYTRSILADGIITTIEISYDPDLAAAFEPILARTGASLMTLPGEGIRGAHPAH